MNYQHIYHAGNFADVFKHEILTLCLEEFHKKSEPFFVLDTHAGLGKYKLDDEKALRTNEAKDGIFASLRTSRSNPLPKNYLKILAKTNCCEVAELPHKLKIYAGSPIIIKYFMRPQDKAVLAELNTKTFFELKRNFAGNKKFTLLNQDGFEVLKNFTPLEKRGLVIIDPAFEKDQSKISADYEKIISSLKVAQKHLPHAVFLIWHPIIKGEEKMLGEFYAQIRALKFPKILHKKIKKGSDPFSKMEECGMFVINGCQAVEELF